MTPEPGRTRMAPPLRHVSLLTLVPTPWFASTHHWNTMVATRTEKSSKTATGGQPFYSLSRPGSRAPSPAPPDPGPLPSIQPSSSSYADPQPLPSDLFGTQLTSVMHLPQILVTPSATPHDGDPILPNPATFNMPDLHSEIGSTFHGPSGVDPLTLIGLPGIDRNAVSIVCAECLPSYSVITGHIQQQSKHDLQFWRRRFQLQPSLQFSQ